ncbi:hypothetical protein M0811_07554 [Anaeramoeba ignava]|uniref:PAS domain-containing protein n=1 Tax=Anaeramoeba ignava TaxID=1746090 RepID=A0A9Q0LKL2_ANAIG|nr:hypothetical protein M0811_07554 [Anaeramoeba ignava]
MGIKHSISTVISSRKKKSFLKLLGFSIESIILVNNSDKILYANSVAENFFCDSTKKSLTHFKFSEISNQNQFQMNKSFQEAQIEIIDKIIKANDQAYDFDWVMKTISGKELLVHIWATLIDFGGEICVQQIIRKTPNFKKTETSQKSETSQEKNSESNLDSNSEKSGIISKNNPFNQIDVSNLSSTDKTSTSSQVTPVINIRNPTFLSVEDQEFEEDLENKIDTTKMKIRSFDDPEIELKIVDALNSIQKLSLEWISSKNLFLQDISDRIQSERQKFRQKYNQLESQLQRRLGGFEAEKEVKNSVVKKNEKLKKQLDSISEIIKEQSPITQKLYQEVKNLETN